MKNSMIYKAMILVMALTLAACGGGGGGGGGGDTPPTGGGGGGGGGAGGGGGSSNGNLSFYSLSTDGTEDNDDVSTAPVSAATVANKFFISVYSANEIEVGVHSPTCLNGGSAADYSLVLLSYTNASVPTTISMRVGSSGVETAVDVFDDTFNDKSREGATTTVSGTCTSGKMSLTGGATVISNGEVAVYQDASGNLYAGLSSTVALNTMLNTNSQISIDDGIGSATSFTYLFADSFSTTATTSNNSSGATFRVFNGAIKVGSTINADLTTNTGVGINSYSYTANDGAGTVYRGVAGTVGGKQVSLSSVANTCGASTVASYSKCTGASIIYLAVEN